MSDWASYLKTNYKSAHNFTYSQLIARYTSELYNKFLLGVEDNSTIVDIGIGNGVALLEQKNINLIFGKRLQIFGYDIDDEYLRECKEKVNECKLNNHVFLYKKDVTKENIVFSQRVDYLFLSNSYSVIPNVLELLEQSIKKFAPQLVIISTTLEENESTFRKIMKPRLKYFTFGVEFGRMITQEMFEKEISSIGLKIQSKDIVCNPSLFGFLPADVWTYVLQPKKANHNCY